MKNLKTLLQSSYFYILLFIITSIYVIVSTNVIEYKSKYSGLENKFVAKIDSISIDGDLLKIDLFAKEKIIGNYYFNSEEEKLSFTYLYEIGDIVEIEGSLRIPSNNTNPNLFNYKKHLYRNKIFYLLKIEKISLIEKNNNIFMMVKNDLLNRINKLSKSGAYVNAFVLGDVGMIDVDVQGNYREIGISHLFSISGMHITLMALFLFWLFEKTGGMKYIIVVIALFFYLVLIGFVASAVRAALMFILINVNKLFKLEIDIFRLMVLAVLIMVILDPFIVYNIGFQYSCIVSMFLMLFSDNINNLNGYVSKLLMTSYMAFLASIPISLYNFYELNFLSIFNNLVFVPLVNFILFPLSIIVLFFPFFDNLLFITISVMEELASILNVEYFSIIFIKLNLCFYFFYYLLVYIGLKNKKYLVFLLLLLFVHSNYNKFFKSDYMLMIDVGQGDSILFYSDNKTVLIDTGGSVTFSKEEWQIRKKSYSIASDTIIPLLKSLGIKKIDYLFLTHGDLDHLGEADKLVNSFVVERVLFNNYSFNQSEEKVINLLENKKINYSSVNANEMVNIGNFNFLVGIREYNNENDNSIVLMVEREDFRVLLMGDASVKVENDLVDSGFVRKVDILKIGHHGSKTSTSEKFLEVTNPSLAIISAGRNNLFNHPNNEVVDRLKSRNILIHSTKEDGAFWIKFNKKVSTFKYPA